jgi:hypothetical protein
MVSHLSFCYWAIAILKVIPGIAVPKTGLRPPRWFLKLVVGELMKGLEIRDMKVL